MDYISRFSCRNLTVVEENHSFLDFLKNNMICNDIGGLNRRSDWQMEYNGCAKFECIFDKESGSNVLPINSDFPNHGGFSWLVNAD